MSSIDRYEGLCLTGPWDGKMVARDMPNFRVAIATQLPLPVWMPELSLYSDVPPPDPIQEFCYYYARIANAGFWTPHGWTDPNVMVALCQRYVRNSSEELRDAYTQQALADGRRNDPLAR